ncbi:MAG: hypothetical protein Q8O03_00645 [Nanoarchaeota archaeon]|nr:hypothetical protein [Nanoarchaeota archaeon]
MDKKTATLTLTEKLRDNNNYHVIINPYYQKKLLEESIACYQIGEIIAFGSYAIRDSLKNKNSALYEKLEPKANYLFIESFEIDKRATASSFAIIGGEEINQLRDTFYKNVPSDIEIAMKVLDIKNYAQLYQDYFDNGLADILKNYPLYSKLKSCLPYIYREGLNYKPCRLLEKYFGMSLKKLNQELKNLNICTTVDTSGSVYKGDIIDLILDIEQSTLLGQFGDLLEGFFNFVFTIPNEERNIETNKAILKLPCETLDYVKILTGEYFKGKNFSEYFDCLDAEKQKKVINALESSKTDNSVYNSFLWSRGFKTIGLDHLRLYKEDAKRFITYFQGKNIEEKKAIVKDIMNCDATNEEVVNWLNEYCLDIVREVGLSND